MSHDCIYYYHNLKSNMDRFIAESALQSGRFLFYLKSNTDRFIDRNQIAQKSFGKI